MKESKMLAGASGKGVINTFMVRLDELNEAAPHLDPVIVARRVVDIADELVEGLYPGEADDPNIPGTGLIWERLRVLRTDEEVEEETTPARPAAIEERPSTEEA